MAYPYGTNCESRKQLNSEIMRKIQHRYQALDEPLMTLAQHSAAHDIIVAHAMRDTSTIETP